MSNLLEEYLQIKERWAKAKQDHVFKFWSILTSQEKEALLSQLKVL
jgi:hypothetical protein